MKWFFSSLIACLSILLNVHSQTNTATNITSSLTIIDERTGDERIQFLLEVAQTYIEEKDYLSAIDAFDRILLIDPQHKQAQYIAAHIYINAKLYKKAEESLIKLANENPEDFQLWNNLAWLYATAEDPAIRNGKKAVKYAHEAMVLAPNDHHVWSTLSEAYYVSGDYEKSYRAIVHMAALAARYGKNITEESVNEYNEQIRKCKRAMDTAESMNAAKED